MTFPRRSVVASVLALLATSPAYANDHFARVNEVLLSYGGDASKQFIEIEDTANEAFDGGGYTLFIYGADGSTQEHSQAVVLSPGVHRVTLASTSAFTQFGLTTMTAPPTVIINLGESLPVSGTACFRKSGVDLHCLSWGTATKPAQVPANGRVAGPTPMDSMSLQRQDTCAGVGAPTPNAANATLTCVDPPTGGGGGDAGTEPMPAPDDCSASKGGVGWFSLVAMASLVMVARRRRVA